MKYTFLKLKQGDDWGWWLVIQPSDIETALDAHRRVAGGLFLKFQKNPHFKGAVLEKGPVELAARWLQTMEKLLQAGAPVYVNQAGGMFAGRRLPLNVLSVVESEKMIFPPSQRSIQTRKIDIQRWYGGEHFYLQCQDKVIFSREKFDTLAEAQAEAELYALPDNIRLSDAKFAYTKDGD